LVDQLIDHSTIFTDHAIGQARYAPDVPTDVSDRAGPEPSDAPRRMTRAQQRVATRQAILEATVTCLIEDGYSQLATRRIAERAQIAQSTLMHHFPTRETLLIEAVTHLAMRMAEQALDSVELTNLQSPDRREAVLDQGWAEFTSPPALAAASMWAAAWAEPDLAPTLRGIEERLTGIILDAVGAFLPDVADDPRLPALLDAVVALIRGLVMAIPINGLDDVDRRWQHIKPFVLQGAAHLLDDPD
jgi:AcrR family transcriptional regulator